jgi:diaminopimelate epimerase
VTDFARFQALGNDYLVIDPHRTDFTPTPEGVRLVCDRHFGVGADGVLFGPIGPVQPHRPVELRIFNSDGGECEKSGNGIRMFALYLAEHYVDDDEFTVHTMAGDAPVWVRDLARGIVRVQMGRPLFDAEDVPVLGVRGPVIAQPLTVDGRELTVTCVDIGNPHTVVPMDQISREAAQELGPRIARHPRFPRGTNVQLLRVVDRRTIEIEIWERGAGYTLASGSSSCAAASAAHVLGLVDEAVEVRMPGGVLEIGIGGDGAVTMTGTAEQVATGSFAPAFRSRLGLPPPARGRRAVSPAAGRERAAR